MPAPTNARQADRGGRTYLWPPTGENFDSVTTILKALGAPGLTYWAAKMVAEGALAHLDEWQALLRDEGADAALRYLKGLPWDRRDKAADAGSSVHAAIAQLLLTGRYDPWPTKLRGHQRQFDRFLAAYQPTWLTSEATVYSRKYGYAGTLDFRCTIDGVTYLGDVKTGERIYDEVALQLAAYRYADWIDLGDNRETPVAPVDGAAVLHLRPQSYHLRTVTADETQHRFFLHILQAHRWQQAVKSTSLVGDMIMPVNLVDPPTPPVVQPLVGAEVLDGLAMTPDEAAAYRRGDDMLGAPTLDDLLGGTP